MPFKLHISRRKGRSRHFPHELEHVDDGKDPLKLKKVRICLARIETDPKDILAFHSHKYNDKKGKNGEDVWESYVENNNPSAWRVFWHYGPNKDEITILLITPRPGRRRVRK